MKKYRRLNKGMRFVAAAALSAALLGSQVPALVVAESRTESASGLELEDLFPDNITVSDSVTLAEVELPENKYGKLEWMDDSIELTERVQSCEVLFVPEEDLDLDLTDMEGWDEELGGVVSEIRVIVSSIAENESEEGQAELEDAPAEEELSEEDVQSSDCEDMEIIEESVDTEADTEAGTDDIAGNQEDASEDLQGEAVEDSKEDKEEAAEDTSVEEQGDSAEDNAVVEDEHAADKEESENKEETGNKDEAVDKEESADKENTEAQDDVHTDSEEQNHTEDNSEEGNSNIFDNPEDFENKEERPTELPENHAELTEEEKLQLAAENHSCQGIYVSGINLPWYVQFRATSGESYEFTNESDAVIFKSYEFELWDLQNNTEYEIPDGEYISVTVPVKEGYDYTIEHLLDNGATETIIPSVEGSTMVFSTHSFSPFGIAGSLQLVGPDFPIQDETKPSVTPTPTITGVPGQNGTAGNNGNGTTGNVGGTTGNGTAGNNNGSTGNGTGTSGSNGGTGAGDGSLQSGGAVNNGQGSTAGNSGVSGNSQNGTTGNNVNVQNGGQSSNSHAVATGDTTAILPFVILIFAAAILIGAVAFVKTKKK